MVAPRTFILIGRSGSGKGTQAKLLIEHLRKGGTQEILYLEMGKLFRAFVKGESYSQKLSKALYEKGALQPAFLTVHLWSNFFVEYMKKDVHMVLDGTPRKFHEAQVLDSALRFYNRKKTVVLNIDVSRKWARERLIGRGREDDSKKGIEERLNWFDTEVKKSLHVFKNSNHYEYLVINGEQSIEEVFKEIVDKVFNK
jgi:adenylate kinase family enzyme